MAMKKIGKIALIACSGAVVAPAAQASDVTLRFAHEAPESAIKGQSANKFAELVSEYTDGSVTVQVYPGGQLIPTTDEIRAVARGQVDIVAPYTSYFSSIDSAWDVFYQPLLFDSPSDAVETFAGALGEELLERLSDRGMTGLGIWHDGPVYLFDSDTPIETPEGLHRKSVRVAPSRPIEAALQAAGATAVSIPASETYLALQQGVADAVVTTPTYVGPAQWDEVLSSGTKLMFGVGGYAFIINTNSLDQLDEEQQEALWRAATEATEWNQKQALDNIEHWETTLEENGLVWFKPSKEELQVWQPIVDAAEAAQTDEAKALIDTVRASRSDD